MIIANPRFHTFIKSSANAADYMFIDPPWNYKPSTYGNTEFWSNVTYCDLFQCLTTSNIFVWTNLEMLPSLMAGYIDSPFELRALIPYFRVVKHEDVLYSMKQGFKLPSQFLAVLATKDSKLTNVYNKSIILEYDNELQRPVLWEDNLFLQLSSEGYRGIYLLPDGNVADTDISERADSIQMVKKELF